VYAASYLVTRDEISRRSSLSSGTRENYADAALRFDWIIVGNTRKYNIESRKLSKSARSWPTIISI